MKSTTNFSLTIDLPDGKLDTIIAYFRTIIPALVTECIKQIILAFAEVARCQTPCPACGVVGKLHWKTRHGEETFILTPYGKSTLRQLQVQCACSHKFYLTRLILGLDKWARTSPRITRGFSLIGALATFRVAEKIAALCGVVLNRMQVWRSVQKVGRTIQFKLDPDQKNEAQADGTGMPIRGSTKRGQELKIVVQGLKSGGVRVAGMAIGAYNGGWDKLFKPIIEGIKSFSSFLLITDGDTSILAAVKDILTVKFQRCLWHIPHQLKFALWQDKVKRKSAEWTNIMSRIYAIVSSRNIQGEDDELIHKVVAERMQMLYKLIVDCASSNHPHCMMYLANAHKDLFTGLLNRFSGRTTSHVERVMRTVNMRSNVGGTWSDTGVLNVNKIRLAYYYNGFDIDSETVA